KSRHVYRTAPSDRSYRHHAHGTHRDQPARRSRVARKDIRRMKIYYDKDTNLDLIRDKQIAVIGYGSQGFAQANNLKDSGCKVTVGLREGSASWSKAESAGLRVSPVAQAAAEADLVMMLVPDELAPDIYAREVAESITPGKYLAFSHGF